MTRHFSEMNILLLLLSGHVLLGRQGCVGFCDLEEIISDTLTRLPRDFPSAIKDIAEGLSTKTLTVVTGNTTNIRSTDMTDLLCLLCNHNIQVLNLDIGSFDGKEKYFDYLKQSLDNSEDRNSLILCEPSECESILYELTENNLIHRTILYLFYWPYGAVSDRFRLTMKEAMRVAVITNPRDGVYRVYYNQACPNRQRHLELINWWAGRLYKSPVLPKPNTLYKDFRGRVFDVPVLHAPPWHFVQYNNDSTINVTGGRDDKLLALMSSKLNFRYRYYDPPDRSQGSSISGNGTFKGTLGLIWKRQADFFLGDVTMTWERLQAVDFSFLTLADSGAFLTHAPAKLSETLALIRPFQWKVWPLVVVTLMLSGPALWMVISAPSLWQKNKHTDQLTLLSNCCWFTTTLFLRQSSSKEPSKTHKARLLSVLFSLGATYVISDMYSANLTSLLARPAREQPIGTLQALEEAMRDRGYELVVERHSSSLTILQNGTGVYGRLARLMRRQSVQRVRSVEVGVRLVLSQRKVAILGGRETLYYDTERFVMTLFEAGILAKITTDEYKNLPEHSRRSDPVTETDKTSSDVPGDSPSAQIPTESTKGLEPVSLRMLRGAFCLLGIGYLLAALALAVEIQVYRRAIRLSKQVAKHRVKKCHRMLFITKSRLMVARAFRRAVAAIFRSVDRALAPEA